MKCWLWGDDESHKGLGVFQGMYVENAQKGVTFRNCHTKFLKKAEINHRLRRK